MSASSPRPLFDSSPLRTDGRRFQRSPSARLMVLLIAALAAVYLGAGCRVAAGADDPLRIAVASNFRDTAQQFADRYTQQTGIAITLSSAASGVLAAQILRGAPFDLFLAADRARAAAVEAAGRSSGPMACYARGRLVLLGAQDLHAALSDARLSVAIANPRSAPYGRAASAVLERDGFAAADTRRVLRGVNVQQALQFFDSGAADLALVARSLADGRGVPVPEGWHAPIEQYAVVVGGGAQSDAARAFLDALLDRKTRPLLTAHGYEACA